MDLQVLSGGAAQGLVRKLEPNFKQAGGAGIGGSFGAVGAMRDKFFAGDACDLLILTEAMIGDLIRSGHAVAATAAPIGRVRTGVAVREGSPVPSISDSTALRAVFSGATGLYFPDPEKATAGIHVTKVLRGLGLEQELASRLRPYPNGATAMREMAACGDPRVVGCTQITEIVITPGVRLVGPLPKEFELVTVYSVAVSTRSTQPDAAARFARLLTSAESATARTACGFE